MPVTVETAPIWIGPFSQVGAASADPAEIAKAAAVPASAVKVVL